MDVGCTPHTVVVDEPSSIVNRVISVKIIEKYLSRKTLPTLQAKNNLNLLIAVQLAFNICEKETIKSLHS